jgi:hypothetical protein
VVESTHQKQLIKRFGIIRNPLHDNQRKEGSAQRKLNPSWNGQVVDDAGSCQQTSIVSPLTAFNRIERLPYTASP